MVAFNYRIGAIVRARGLAGEAVVRFFRPRIMTGPVRGTVALINDSSVEYALAGATSLDPDNCALRLEGVGDRNAAEALIGWVLAVDPNALPSGLTDDVDRLFGRHAIDIATKEGLGTVVDIRSNGAQPILVIGEDEILVPAVDAFIAYVKEEDGRSVVGLNILPGLIEANQ